MLKVIKANYQDNYKISVKFNDYKSGVIDLQDLILNSKIKPFKQLKDLKKFKNFKVDYTLRWGNDLDLAPEYLYFKAFESDINLVDKFKDWGYI